MAKTKKNAVGYGKRDTWSYDLKKNGVLYLIFLIPLTYFIILSTFQWLGL